MRKCLSFARHCWRTTSIFHEDYQHTLSTAHDGNITNEASLTFIRPIRLRRLHLVKLGRERSLHLGIGREEAFRLFILEPVA